MGDSEGTPVITPTTEEMDVVSFLSNFMEDKSYGAAVAVFIAIVVPLVISSMFMGKKKAKHRRVPVQVGGEAGFAKRNIRSSKLVDVPWEGATTMAALFEQSCKKHSELRFLGTRKLIARDFVTGSDGRKFEKLHLGEYQWETYEQIFLACLQLCLWTSQTKISTLICDSKLLNKVATVSSSLKTVKNVIYFENDNIEASTNISDWKISSFSEVEKMGQKNSIHAKLPIKKDIAVIMYTSGSTGLPKMITFIQSIMIRAATPPSLLPVLDRNTHDYTLPEEYQHKLKVVPFSNCLIAGVIYHSFTIQVSL